MNALQEMAERNVEVHMAVNPTGADAEVDTAAANESDASFHSTEDDDQSINDRIDQAHEQPVAKARPVNREDRHPRSRAASAGYPVNTNSPRSTLRPSVERVKIL